MLLDSMMMCGESFRRSRSAGVASASLPCSVRTHQTLGSGCEEARCVESPVRFFSCEIAQE
jgi:hypothetical protein